MKRVLKAPSFPLYLAVAMWLGFFVITKWWPASWWYEVGAVYIHEAEEGEPILMEVDRQIKRDFVGAWVVTVRRVDDERQEVACSAFGEADYKQGTDLPITLTLDWWTNGACRTLPAGRYYVSTNWMIRDQPLWPAKAVSVVSNIFEVRR